MTAPLPVVLALTRPRPRLPLALCRTCGTPWQVCDRIRRVAAAVERMGDPVDPHDVACCTACARHSAWHSPKVPRIAALGRNRRGRSGVARYTKWQQTPPAERDLNPAPPLQPPQRQ